MKQKMRSEMMLKTRQKEKDDEGEEGIIRN